jgi:hypothetical protein
MGNRILILFMLFFTASASGQKIENAIIKSTDFLKSRQSELFPDAYVILDYLTRKYELKFSYDPIEVYNIFHHPDKDYIVHFYRIIDPKKTVTKSSIDQIENLADHYLAEALYCDLYGLNSNYLKIIENEIASDGYSLTHSLLAMQWLEEKKCISTAEFKGLKDSAIIKTSLLAERENYNTDLGIESLAFLCYSDNHTLVSYEMINKVIEAQKTDGGWGYNPEDPFSNDHTTILALWLLLAYQNPVMNPHVMWVNK